jgi:CBS domain-containing protein
MRTLHTKHTKKPAYKSALRPQRAARKTAATVRDLMSSSVQVLDPALTLREAVELLAAQHITGAPVVSAGKLVGAISANDILAFEADTPGVPTEQPSEGEDENVPELQADETWERAAEAPNAYFTDLWVDAGADVAERFDALAGPEWDVLNEHTVAEAMSQGVRGLSPDMTVADAAAYMLSERVHRAVVLDHTKLVGILTATDIMRAVAERRI